MKMEQSNPPTAVGSNAGLGVSFDEGSVLSRLLRSLGPFGFVAVDPERVNLEDLCAGPGEGRIVRVLGDPRECIQVFAAGSDETLGCVAGWISEDA
jgi:hypothetical protein